MGIVQFPGKGESFDPGGGGGDDGGVESRLSAMEARWDATLPTLATKAEMAELRAEVHRGFGEMTKWIVGSAVALAAAGITVMTFVLNNAVPKQAQQQPTVIVIPASLYGAAAAQTAASGAVVVTPGK